MMVITYKNNNIVDNKQQTMELEDLKDDLIAGLKDQMNLYRELLKTDDQIIEKQAEYIKKLEDLLAESKTLLKESVDLLKQLRTTL